MASPETQLKDFIYLDIDRIKSFVAQLYEGVPEAFEDDYQEYRERMRYLYSQIMSDEELDLHFP